MRTLSHQMMHFISVWQLLLWPSTKAQPNIHLSCTYTVIWRLKASGSASKLLSQVYNPNNKEHLCCRPNVVENFCSWLNRTLMHASEFNELLFVTHLTTFNLSHHQSHATMSLSLHCTTYVCMSLLGSIPTLLSNSHHIYSKCLKAFKKVPSPIKPPRVHLPTTLCIMQSMKCLLLQKPPSYDNVLI